MFVKIGQWIKAIFGQAARDRLYLCEDKLKYCNKELDECKLASKSLKDKLDEVSAKLKVYEDRENYEDLGVCLIPKNYIVLPAPRCPNCTKVMTKYGVWYKCTPCEYMAPEKLVQIAMKKFYDLKRHQI